MILRGEVCLLDADVEGRDGGAESVILLYYARYKEELANSVVGDPWILIRPNLQVAVNFHEDLDLLQNGLLEVG